MADSIRLLLTVEDAQRISHFLKDGFAFSDLMSGKKKRKWRLLRLFFLFLLVALFYFISQGGRHV